MDDLTRDADLKRIGELLGRIAAALERLAPSPPGLPNRLPHAAYVWQAERSALEPVERVAAIAIDLLKAIDHVRDILLENTRRFAMGLPANNALLWGARGMGKSSLVKAIHRQLNLELKDPFILIEIHREDIASLPRLMGLLRGSDRRALIFCDDLSFDAADTSYKSLKAVLEGGIEGRPANVLFYATSNRRHLMPREMLENERSTAINPHEAVEEKVSLSDRFGLWLGFHNCSQDDYLRMVDAYAGHYGLTMEKAKRDAAALEWSATRGSRSGRVAWQFIQDLAGRLGQTLDETQAPKSKTTAQRQKPGA